MTIVLFVVTIAAVFYAGKRYGATAEKAIVAGGLAAFTKAKTELVSLVTKAQADATAEVARLEALAKRYL